VFDLTSRNSISNDGWLASSLLYAPKKNTEFSINSFHNAKVSDFGAFAVKSIVVKGVINLYVELKSN
jgi:hypothetical protein